MNMKHYPEDFKIEAVKQVTVAGHSVTDVAQRTGTTIHCHYAWIKRYGPESEKYQKQSDETSVKVWRKSRAQTYEASRAAGSRSQRASNNC